MDVRCQIVFQGGSGLPEDRFINTWHFVSTETDLESAATELSVWVINFWNDTPPGGNSPPVSRLSPWVLLPAELRFYDLGDPEPRVPFIIPWTREASGSLNGLPEECAVVLSLRAVAPVTARRRGRSYIGPLGSNGITLGSTTVRALVTPVFQSDLAAAATQLRVGVFSLGAGNFWAIRSSLPTPNMVQIDGGWIDNAPDTQRRRGPDSTSRFLWGTPL